VRHGDAGAAGATGSGGDPDGADGTGSDPANAAVAAVDWSAEVPHLDALLGLVADSVVTIHEDGRIGYASPAVRQLMGFDPHTLIGQPARTYLDPDEADEVLAAVFRPAGPRDPGRRVRLRHADGGFRDVQAFSRPSVAPGADFVPVVMRPLDTGVHTLDALRHRLAFEDLLTHIASTFIHRPAHEVNEGITTTLAAIGKFASVDRAYVYLLHDTRNVFEATHEWLNQGVPPARDEDRFVGVDEWPQWMATLRDDDAVYLPRVDDLTDGWQAEREHLERIGVRSSLAVPVSDGERLVGFIGFELVTSERLWSDDHLAVLTSTAGIISQALARQEAEQRFGLAFDRAPLGMALHGPDGRHLQVNPAYCELLGCAEEDIVGTPVLAYVIEEDRSALVEQHRLLVAGAIDQLVMELRFTRRDGPVVWCRVHSAAVRSRDESLRYTVSHVEDVTNLKQREIELRASETRYRTLVENSPAIVVRFNRDHEVVYVSRAAEQLTGRPTEELLRDPSVLFAKEGRARGWYDDLQAVFDSGVRHDGEWQVDLEDGPHWFQSRSVPEFDEHGAVEHVLVLNTDITALKRGEAELAHQALHDPLTGLANRALLLDHVTRALARRRVPGASPHPPALLFIDLDRFKLVNDSLGHRAGDRLLVAVAERLAALVRPSDLISRLGGDEFVVVIDSVDDPAELVRVAERIKQELAVPMEVGGNEVVTTGSIGIAVPTAETADAEGLLRDADAAMYLAKANGRNRFEIFDTFLRTQATEKLQMESALRRSLDAGAFEVHYQPELDLGTGEVVGFEALVRWNHPTEGRLAAWAFIELAEETGIILELGEWVLREACRQAGEWRRERPDQHLTLRVNLSGRQFAQANLVEQVVGALDAAQIEPSSLCLEITETALMEDPAKGLRVLNDLRALGISLAIDDFGTGYSSLAYLKRFPVDVLKIDRSFVDGLGDDPDDTAIATAIISLARSMGLRVVAEGVETRRQLDELRRLGCDHAQGFLFAKPTAPADLWEVARPFDVRGGADVDGPGAAATGSAVDVATDVALDVREADAPDGPTLDLR
jgi:diguanylate cyclase (GGDEF)-like protein/PAS domain S-box-containing protein